MLVEVLDGTLGLFPIEQCHKGWGGKGGSDICSVSIKRKFHTQQVSNLGCDTFSPLAGLIKDNAGGTMSPHASFYVTANISLIQTTMGVISAGILPDMSVMLIAKKSHLDLYEF